MSSILSQVSYQIFLYCVFIFFILASIFAFIVGVGLALRSSRMMRFMHFMNRGFSVRRLMQPMTKPHFIEPVLLKHNRVLGISFILGATVSIFLLWDLDPAIFKHVYLGSFEREEVEVLAEYTKSFLLVGNGVCLLIGMLALFFPQLLSRIEGYTDKWYTLRKQTRPLTQNHLDVDQWVLAHPTVSGVTLSIMSVVLSVSMYMRF